MNFRHFTIILVIIIIVGMWAYMMWFIKNYGDEVANDPCKICAKRMNQDVSFTDTCLVRTYYKNGTIEDEEMPGCISSKSNIEVNITQIEEVMGI